MTLHPELLDAIRDAKRQGGSDREIARACGLRVAEVRAVDVPARTRDAAEFTGAVDRSQKRAPRTRLASTVWDIRLISEAIDAQLKGQFAKPVDMVRRMQRNYAIFVAKQNRVAPSSAVAVELRPSSARNPQAKAVANAARKHCIAPRSVLKGIHQTLVDHAVAIGFVRHGATLDGGYTTARLEEWPLEHVKWNASIRELETAVEGELNTIITHGDGNWIVFRRVDSEPWARDACVCPAGLVWAAHTEGLNSWAAGARSHGQARITGQLPEGVTLRRADGSMSPEAEAFRDLLVRLASGDDAAGIIPPGAIVDFLANPSNAWQVFSELGLSQEKAAARIYTGSDAALGSVGGAPGVDISLLFGVASTLVQGDFDALQQGLNVGLYQPWTALNYGSSKFAPRAEYMLPDPDAERMREESSKNRQRFAEALKLYEERGFEITQELVDDLAAEYGIAPPTMAAKEAKRIPLALAPTDAAKVVTVNEARASQGLPALSDEKGNKFISELEAAAEAAGEIAVEEAAPAPEPTP